MPSTGTGFREYTTDRAKVKSYADRLFVADQRFDKEKGLIESLHKRYENQAMRAQVTPQGHRINAPTPVAVVDALYSSLTAIDVEFVLKAMAQAPREQAELASNALNHEYDHLGVQQKANDAIKDSLIGGLGWVKVAYEYLSDTLTEPRDLNDIRRDIVELMREAQDAGVEAPTADQVAELVAVEEEVEKVLRDRIVVDYVPWDQVRYDPTAKRLEDITWIAQYTRMPLYQVKENPTWKEYVKRTRGGTRKLEELKSNATFDENELPPGAPTPDMQFVDVVEFTDFESGTVCTFVKGQDWLLNESVNPLALNLDYIDRSPFIGLSLRRTTTRVRGIGDMELIAPSHDEQNVYRSKTATYIERFVPKMVGPEDGLTPEGQDALSSSEYGAYVATARELPPNAIQPLAPPVLPAEAWQMDERIERSIFDATGANELIRGLFPDRKRTATETAEVVSSSAARQSEKRNTLEAFHLAIARRILQLMQVYYDQPRMARYSDPTYGEVAWEFTAEDLVMEYDLKVYLSPKEAVTKQTERDDALALFNMLMPLAQQPQPDGSHIIKADELVAWFCRKYGLQNTEIMDILNLPEERQAEQLAAQQAQAGQASAAGGVPQPGMTTGPLGPSEVAALTNQGAVPPEVIAAASGAGPGSPQAVEQVSESAGVRIP